MNSRSCYKNRCPVCNKEIPKGTVMCHECTVIYDSTVRKEYSSLRYCPHCCRYTIGNNCLI